MLGTFWEDGKIFLSQTDYDEDLKIKIRILFEIFTGIRTFQYVLIHNYGVCHGLDFENLYNEGRIKENKNQITKI